MCKNQGFYVCKHCGNIIRMVKNSGVPVICCGEPMSKLVPNTVEAATEKHIPVVSVNSNVVTVNVGENQHPMTSEHLIEWIAVVTEKGEYIRCLTADDEPTAIFTLSDNETVQEVFAFCNLHGLWQAKQ